MLLVDNENSGVDKENSEAEEMDEIRLWALECNISMIHLKKLITILRRRLLPELPKDPRTFIQTKQSKFNIQDMEDVYPGEMGEFIYFGIAQGL